MSDLPQYGTATTRKEAQTLAATEARRRYGKLSLDKLLAGAQQDYKEFRILASRAMVKGISLGLRLIEFKRRAPHGDFLAELERMDIPKTTALRFRELAEALPLLPESPPDGTRMWSMDRALTYARSHAELAEEDDVDALDAATVHDKVKARTERKRRTKAAAQLHGVILKAEAMIQQALAEADPAALAAIDTMRLALARLDDSARRFAKEADHYRKTDAQAQALPHDWDPEWDDAPQAAKSKARR